MKSGLFDRIEANPLKSTVMDGAAFEMPGGRGKLIRGKGDELGHGMASRGLACVCFLGVGGKQKNGDEKRAEIWAS